MAVAVVDSAPPQTELPIPCRQFIASLKGTTDEVWSRLLKNDHGVKNLTPAAWRETLTQLKTRRV